MIYNEFDKIYIIINQPEVLKCHPERVKKSLSPNSLSK